MDEDTELAHSPTSTDQSWDLNPQGLTPEPREREGEEGQICAPTKSPVVHLFPFTYRQNWITNH